MELIKGTEELRTANIVSVYDMFRDRPTRYIGHGECLSGYAHSAYTEYIELVPG